MTIGPSLHRLVTKRCRKAPSGGPIGQDGESSSSGEHGQSLVEFALVLPLVLVLALGVIEVGYALLDQHVVTRLTREGSNLISRHISLEDAVMAMKTMSSRPVNLDSGSKLIFSVIKKGASTGTNNFDKLILYQRREYGDLSALSTVRTVGTGSFGGSPDFIAANSDSNTNLQVTSLPNDLVIRGGLIYVTEVHTTHNLITPLDRFGIQVPNTLYSIAYF